jgi:hypothetical protein
VKLSDLKAGVTLSVMLELTAQELRALSGLTRFLREDPRKAWIVAEAKQAARQAIVEMVRQELAGRAAGLA